MIWVSADVAVFAVIFFSSGIVDITSEMKGSTGIKDPVYSVHMVLSSEVAYHVWAANNILYIGYNTCGLNRSMYCIIP